MKKTFFFFAMLASVAASAQSHINIEMLSATYTGSPAVKFRVWWSSVPTVTGQTHNAKIWVWVDFLKINADNTTSGNTWTRAEISATPAVSSSPTSTAALDASTNKGFWLNGVTGSYSATVTATLANIPANTKFNWCAYVSDYPPNVSYNNGTYTLHGSSPFRIIAANGTTAQTVTGTTITASALTVTTPVTMTDKTECPNVFCPYTGNDLSVDATHACKLRTSGAQNWEAWIKDTRDSKLYRIVLMPDGKWWLAQNVKYAAKGALYSGCSEDSCGRYYSTTEVYNGNYATNRQTVCPAGWVLPSTTQWNTMATAISSNLVTAFRDLRPLRSGCTPRNDNYGWATRGTNYCPQVPSDGVHWHATDGTGSRSAGIDDGGGEGLACNSTSEWLAYSNKAGYSFAARCIRP
jgi:uncharacterized protein (TIGR02145 family)